MPENQQHRAEVCKLLVHRRARRQGVAVALMKEIEKVAIEERKTLLVLDTATEEAERLYQKLGWTSCGRIPNFCVAPRGGLLATVLYYKELVSTD